MTVLNEPLATENGSAGWTALLSEARNAAAWEDVQRLVRARRRLLAQGPAPTLPAHARIAVLGGATTSMLIEPLQLRLESLGVAATIHEAAYNTFSREMLDASSATVAFRPDFAVVVLSPFNIPTWPEWNATREEVADRVGEVVEHFLAHCRTLHDATGCAIVLSNFHALPVRPLGTAGTRLEGEPGRFLGAVNDELARRAPAFVYIHDVAALAALHGIHRWYDQRFWFHAKQPVSFECLVPYVSNVAAIIASARGRSSKCVVVDLDNTLWGGVVGDDGPEHIVIGQGHPVGEAFAAFQLYLRRLRERGVLLAVVSKNDEVNALAPFSMRPEMVLRRDDFVAFRANWRPKSENLVEIAAELNIGLDSIVFVDDNPAEREEVRRALPEVRVLEPGDDPSDYAVRLDQTGWLDAVAVSSEDRARSGMYAANAARAEAKAAATDYEGYLASLEQRAVVAPFEERHLDRIAQLTARTNQFNLTMRRATRGELAAMMGAADHITACVRLADRFGDNGLISVFAAHAVGGELWIDLWLMSCRVFHRGVEQLLCNHVVERARAAGYRTLHGVYTAAPRNALVKDLLPSLGFRDAAPVEGMPHWALDLGRYQPMASPITVVPEY